MQKSKILWYISPPQELRGMFHIHKHTGLYGSIYYNHNSSSMKMHRKSRIHRSHSHRSLRIHLPWKPFCISLKQNFLRERYRDASSVCTAWLTAATLQSGSTVFYNTETEMSSFWWIFHHWLHWKLSKRQLPVQPVIRIWSKWRHFRFSEHVTPSNENIFRVTGHLCGEFTGPRWIPHTKASDAELWCFLWSASE